VRLFPIPTSSVQLFPTREGKEGRTSPSLIAEPSALVQMLEVLRVSVGAEEVEGADLEVGPEVAAVVLLEERERRHMEQERRRRGRQRGGRCKRDERTKSAGGRKKGRSAQSLRRR
jgi:hypothetical protein